MKVVGLTRWSTFPRDCTATLAALPDGDALSFTRLQDMIRPSLSTSDETLTIEDR